MRNDVWAIAPLYQFFSAGDGSREKNFFKFRDSLARQGIKLAVMEITDESLPFILEKDDADKIIQYKTKSILWHKERAINLLIPMLPPECKYVAWFDTDCVLLNDNWANQGIEKLKTHCAVQLCAKIQYMEKDGSNGLPRGTYLYNTYNKAHQINFPGRTEGAPGFCWMMKRHLIQKIKLYDKAIIGGGDILFASTTIHKSLGKNMLCGGKPNARYKDFIAWSTMLRQETRNLKKATYLDGDSCHLWHDERKYRVYGARHYILLLEGFHPKRDLDIEEKTNLYILKNERLEKLLKTYFWFRAMEKTPEHEKLFDVFEMMMMNIKETYQTKQMVEKKLQNQKKEAAKKQTKVATNKLIVS